MRLIEYESLIKSKINENPNNPEIYELLQRMIKVFLLRKKACRCASDYEDISYYLAGDIFMRIISGETISYYLGLIEKLYRKYIQNYYTHNHLDYICLDDPTIFKGEEFTEFDLINQKIYLENIDKVIDRSMMQTCKYDPCGSAFINLKLSLILSLIRGHEVYFHLNSEQKQYLHMILVNFKTKVIKEVSSYGV